MGWENNNSNRAANDGSQGPHWFIILLVLLFLGAVFVAFIWAGGGANQ